MRVAAILNFIAEHPGQSFALTDLVRALKLSRATCHALLTGLVEVGYLYRTSDKTYVLGPALAAIGRTAAQHFSPLQVAQPEMREIADAFDVVCAAYFLEGDTMHLRDRAASASHVGYPVPLGTRMRLRSGQAGIFFAWAPREAEAWINRTSPRPTDERVEQMLRSMDFAREHGFIVLMRRPGFTMTGAMQEQFAPPADTDELPVMPETNLQADVLYPVAAMMAPVFESRDKVGFALVMAGFHAPMTGSQIMDAGARLAAACQRISSFLTDPNSAAA